VTVARLDPRPSHSALPTPPTDICKLSSLHASPLYERACLHQITDRCLAKLAKHLQRLRHMDLSCIQGLSEGGFFALLHMPQLIVLRARFTAIPDAVVTNLLLNNPAMLEMDLSNCSNISNASLSDVPNTKKGIIEAYDPNADALGVLLRGDTAALTMRYGSSGGDAAARAVVVAGGGARVSGGGAGDGVPSDGVGSATAPFGFGGTDAAARGAGRDPSHTGGAYHPSVVSALEHRGFAGSSLSPVPVSAFQGGMDGSTVAMLQSPLGGSRAALVAGRAASPSRTSRASRPALAPDAGGPSAPLFFRLQVLRLSAVNINYVTISCIAALMPDIRTLDIAGSRHLSTGPFKELSLNCTSLESLDLRGCTRVDDESLVLIFASASRYSLRSVNLCGCTSITNTPIEFLAANCTKLHSLNLVDCMRISDASLTRLTHLFLLTRLEIGSTSSLPTLGNPDVTPSGVDKILTARGASYSLMVLRLFNNAVDDLVLSTVSQRCHLLEELYIQDAAVPPIARISEDVLWEEAEEANAGVTTRGIYLLMNGNCRRLRRLQLVDCNRLGYDAMRHVVNASPNPIREMTFKECRGFGARAYTLLAASDFGRQHLRRLSVCDDRCSADMDAMAAILTNCAALEFLEVRNCKLVQPLAAAATQTLLRSVARLPPFLEWAPNEASSVPVTDVMRA
jgi:hypothetical protein